MFMVTVPNEKVLIFADRSSNQRIVRDRDGIYWIVPLIKDPWEHRQPFEFTQDAELEPVPGHYKYLLELPY